MEVTDYLHKLPQCVWGAHLEYHVTEQLTMKYWHVQQKIRTCCCSDLRIQSQGREDCFREYSLASWPDNAGKKKKEKTRNRVFVLSCASLVLHHLPTCA